MLSIETRSGASNFVAFSISFELMPAMTSATSALICAAIVAWQGCAVAEARPAAGETSASTRIGKSDLVMSQPRILPAATLRSGGKGQLARRCELIRCDEHEEGPLRRRLSNV